MERLIGRKVAWGHRLEHAQYLDPSGKGEHTEVTESRDDGSGDNDDDRERRG